MTPDAKTKGVSAATRLSVALIVAGASLAVAAAQTPPEAGVPSVSDFAPFVGTYDAAAFASQAGVIDRAIEAGTEAMGPLRRSVGRRRLHAVNRPVHVLRILVERADVVTEFDGDRYVAPASGAARRGRDPEGEPVRVSYRVAGDSIHARYVGGDGEKRIVFQLSHDGHLALQQTLLSDQLPGPIRYRLDFRRR